VLSASRDPEIGALFDCILHVTAGISEADNFRFGMLRLDQE
jgi:hypothetical protein